MAASFECKSATLSHINTSLGKTVFSGTLEKMDTAGMRGFSWVLWGGEGVLGIMTFPKREKTKIKIQTPSQLVKCKTQNICTYLQIIAFLTRNQIKTFVLTQIHKCKRSVNRLFKGYLLIIYMKRKVSIF